MPNPERLSSTPGDGCGDEAETQMYLALTLSDRPGASIQLPLPISHVQRFPVTRNRLKESTKGTKQRSHETELLRLVSQ